MHNIDYSNSWIVVHACICYERKNSQACHRPSLNPVKNHFMT